MRIFVKLFSLAFCILFSTSAASTDYQLSIERGQQAYITGNFNAASLYLSTALEQAPPSFAARTKLSIQLAHALQAQGRIDEALSVLQQALSVRPQSATLLATLGAFHLLLDQPESAGELLNQIKLPLESSADSALVSYTRAQVQTAQGYLKAAQESYQHAQMQAAQAGDTFLRCKALLGLVSLGVNQENAETAKTCLDKLPGEYEKYALMLTLSQQLYDDFPAMRYELLQQVLDFGKSNNQGYLATYAQGYLGKLYAQNGQIREGISLTRKAVFQSHRDAPASTYQWHWQLGRLLHKQQQTPQALQAYHQAVDSAQINRKGLLQGRYEAGREFDALTGDLYKELAALLIADNHQGSFEKAREILEKLRVVELEDYFRDQCVTNALEQNRGDKTTHFEHTAVLHTLTTNEHLHILLTLPNGDIHYHPATWNVTELRQQIELLRIELQDVASNRFFRLAQQVYAQLLRPLEAYLDMQEVHTLVIVPDETLRLIPLATLHDGERFLIERYAVAAVPALRLTSRQSAVIGTKRALIGGISEAVQGFPALPHVKSELQQIQEVYRGDVLLNHAFDADALENSFVQDVYPIVHIASHGEFGNRPQQSFLLTYDGKITMNRLESLLKSRFQSPVELLTLSACQTALGDDLSALGLAGVAVKAGAKSALASLWQVNDKATAVLITEFYRQLKQPGVGKAQALQRAQQYMLKQNLYRHPTYWSAFLLIGHWQ